MAKIRSLTHILSFMLIVFLNTFMDLGHKILLQDTLFQTYHAHHYIVFSSILNAFILLPYIVFFTPAGFISDKFSKPKVMKATALAAIPITILITICYYHGFFWGAYTLTLILGLQSAINSPAKYGHIKELFSQANIAKANAYAQAMTIIAILSGTLIFTLLFSHSVSHLGSGAALTKEEILQSFAPLGFLLIFFSSLELLMTFFLAKRPAADPTSNYSWKKYIRGGNAITYLKLLFENKTILLCVLSLSLFWAENQVLLVTYGAYLKAHIPDVSVNFAQGSIAIAGIGLLFGAMYAGRISRGYIETGIIPIASIAITIGLFFLANTVSKPLIVFLILTYGFFGGLFIVPLNSLIQYHAKKQQLGKILAGNNFFQNIAMFTFLLGNTVAALYHLNSVYIMHALFVLFFIFSIATIYLLPQSLVHYILGTVARKFYRVNAVGFDNIPEQGGVLLLGNHASFMDWAILQIACPRKIRFVMDKTVFNKWYLKWFFTALKMIPISRGSSKQAIENINKALNDGDIVCIFPEGRLSRNGQLGDFKSGFERAIANTSAVIVPFYIRGLWGSKTSYAPRKFKALSKSGVRHAVSVTFGNTLTSEATAKEVKQSVTQLSAEAWENYAKNHNNIVEAFYHRAKEMTSSLAIIDANGNKLKYGTTMGVVAYLRKAWHKITTSQKNIGIILPASSAGILANLSILSLAKTVVNLNFTAGLDNMIFACKSAEIKTIITSRLFIKKLTAKGFDIDTVLKDLNVIYMEDYFTTKAKIKIKIIKNTVLLKILPKFIGRFFLYKKTSPENAAAIVFSSGSEGKPKGVMLSHSNILANVQQMTTVFNIQDNDIILGTLPIFHSFGLTVTTFMPLIVGSPVVCQPDPTDAATIGKLVFKYNITVMYGTSTFFNLYVRNKKCGAELFKSLRVVIAGAEKLSEKVQSAFKLKFSTEIYEGYGATELSPVASCNLPNMIDPSDLHTQISKKEKTVGLPLPGTAFKVVDPESMEELPLGEDGLILVNGPQLMLGYLNDPEKTNDVIIKENGTRWYKTGDKGHIDSEGFLTIVDRYSRFAKIAGEMISLGSVEQKILLIINNDDADVMAIAIPCDKKGEAIALLYDFDMTEDALKMLLLNAEIDNIILPSTFHCVSPLPKLGSGKKDYNSAKSLILNNL